MTAPIIYDPLKWGGFGDFTVTTALSPEDKSTVNGWLEAEHFLGEFKPIGHSLIQVIREDGQAVAVIQWAACAYHLKDREAWIGWSALLCAKRRNLVVNNVRFLVLESARRPNLASKSLAHAVRALPGHWQEHLRDLDLDAFGRVLTAWLGAHRGALPASLALDGKTVRQKLGTIVTLCDVEQKVPVAVAATAAPGGEQACARALLRSGEVSLLNATVSLDALYTNHENAGIIVQEKGGDYLISLKDNQPTVSAYVAEQLASPPFLPAPRRAATGP